MGLGDDAVSGLETPAIRAAGFDGSGELVSEDDGRPIRELVVPDMDIGATDATGGDSDSNLAGAGPSRVRHIADFDKTDPFLGFDKGLHGHDSI